MGGAGAASRKLAVQEEAGTWWQLSSRAHATGELPSCQSLSRQEPALCPHQCLPLAGPGRKPGQGLRGAVCGVICGREDMAARGQVCCRGECTGTCVEEGRVTAISTGSRGVWDENVNWAKAVEMEPRGGFEEHASV